MVDDEEPALDPNVEAKVIHPIDLLAQATEGFYEIKGLAHVAFNLPQ
ncbi:hypothetical protein KQ693_09280 [Thermus sp. PS18]|uniref:Uncharacterized protein n=1 Tax=Thermus brevis TaxID=2862456 RepID=A0ABS6ZWN8_9DEIN|nr:MULTISPECIES: hypothetical protein [Thermus]MBW6394468.1 hypothetical protein [Thermus brevis]UZX14815.1 hypothetical protein KQ693_09280 [Thermus sp. PS18]